MKINQNISPAEYRRRSKKKNKALRETRKQVSIKRRKQQKQKKEGE